MAVLCLKTIKPEISLRTELPQSVSARFNMCGKIAHECSVSYFVIVVLFIIKADV